MNPLASTLLGLAASASSGLSSVASRAERGGRASEADPVAGFARLLDRSRERLTAPTASPPPPAAVTPAERPASSGTPERTESTGREASSRPPAERALAERRMARQDEMRAHERRQAESRTADAEPRKDGADSPAAEPGSPDGRPLAARAARGNASREGRTQRSESNRAAPQPPDGDTPEVVAASHDLRGHARAQVDDPVTDPSTAGAPAVGHSAGGLHWPGHPGARPSADGDAQRTAALDDAPGTVGARVSATSSKDAAEAAIGPGSAMPARSAGPDDLVAAAPDAAFLQTQAGGKASDARGAGVADGPRAALMGRGVGTPIHLGGGDALEGLRAGGLALLRDEPTARGSAADRLGERFDTLLAAAAAGNPASGPVQGAAAAGLAATLASAAEGSASGVVPSIDITDRMDSPGFAPSLASQVSLLARDGIERAEIRLNPVEMGPVAVQIQIDGNQARVEFTAEQAPTRQALESSLPQLAAALREAGLTLSGGGVFQQGGRSGGESGTRQGADGGRGSRSAGSQDAGTPTLGPLSGSRRTAPGGIDLYA